MHLNRINLQRLATALLLPGLAGCHLIDQRDFNPSAGLPPKPPVAAATGPAGPGALITISYGSGEPAYAQALADAVQHAMAAKANVLFTVQTLVPLEGNADAQAASLQAATANGREVAESIVADGADPGQIELAVRADPTQKVKLVRVFVH